MGILGNATRRVEDPALLSVGGRYVADLPLPGALAVHYVRSGVAHGRVRSVSTADAAALPGVVAVLTAADLDVGPLRAGAPGADQSMWRPLLATGTVRFVGEPVAVVVAEDAALAADAAELVEVDIEPLEPLVDPERALEPGAPVLFPDAAAGNLVLEIGERPTDELFAGCEVVVRQRLVNQRLAPCPLEVRAAAARPEPDGRITYWVSTQAPHSARAALCRVLGVEADGAHVVTPDVGGGFGAKIGSYPEELLVGWLARRLGRPVRWVETRSESMVALGHGRAQVQVVEIGGSKDGRIEAYRLSVVQDSGAYPQLGAFLPSFTRTMLTGTYDIPRAELFAQAVVTNTNSTVAYRGAGRPEAASAIERAVDLFAHHLGLDPAEVRRRNLVRRDDFPYTTPVGTVYDSGDYPEALQRVLEAADYDGLRAEQRRRREAGERLLLGIGLSCYVEITNGAPGSEYGRVRVGRDGRIEVAFGTSPHGQGHDTAFAMVAAENLGVPLELIDTVHGDTDRVPRGVGTFGSRSLQTGGVAVARAAAEVLRQARALAAELFEADPADVVPDPAGDALTVAGTPARRLSWGELAEEAERRGTGLVAEVDYLASSPTFPFGAHLAVVEVDVETGFVRLVRLVALDDAGTLVNPMLAAGQVHGGLAQGAAQALFEELRYDTDGTPLGANFADYGLPSAAELPSFERLVMETPTPVNELGAKGIGESGTIGSTPAVHNAVVDALSHLGVVHVDMPCTPERVWRAIAGRGRP